MTILFILKKYNIMEENIQRGVQWGKIGVWQIFLIFGKFLYPENL